MRINGLLYCRVRLYYINLRRAIDLNFFKRNISDICLFIYWVMIGVRNLFSDQPISSFQYACVWSMLLVYIIGFAIIKNVSIINNQKKKGVSSNDK